MENEVTTQPLDQLMTKLGLSNADLVKASTEQLSFKMVQKGRKGVRLTLNIQEKILRALLAAKPGIQLKRRELFHYDLDESVIEKIHKAQKKISSKKIKYPEYIDLLTSAGITRYLVEVGSHRITFYGTGGEAYVQENPKISESSLGYYDEEVLRSTILDAQNDRIDYPTFLKKIYEAGISNYEVNLRNRKISYNGLEHSYRELIPAKDAKPAVKVIAPAKPAPKKVSSKKSKKPKRFRKSHRIKPRK